jgi:hypothetical protein
MASTRDIFGKRNVALDQTTFLTIQYSVFGFIYLRIVRRRLYSPSMTSDADKGLQTTITKKNGYVQIIKIKWREKNRGVGGVQLGASV